MDFHPGPIVCLVSSILAGGAIGFDRESHGHAAGIRTHMLVCLGACLVAAIDRSHAGNGGRIAAQVITGIGFLGAGSILRSEKGHDVHGLTTAASIWTTAAIGIAIGFGNPTFNYAALATLLVLITLSFAHVLERIARIRSRKAELTILVSSQDGSINTATNSIVDMLIKSGTKVHSLSSEAIKDDASHQLIRFKLEFGHGTHRGTVDASIRNNPHVVQTTWEQ